MKSPLTVFLLAALACAGTAGVLVYAGPAVALDIFARVGPLPALYPGDLALPRYFLETGQPAEAVQELIRIMPDLPEASRAVATEGMSRILVLQRSALGQLAFGLLHTSSVWPARLLVAASVFVLCALAAVLIARLGRRPLFVILPFIDYAGLNIGENLPAAVLDRIREVTWRTTHLQSTRGVIAEKLEIPSLGLVGESGSIDTLALIETALLFSTGISDFPLARFFNSLKLWVEQPRYLVRGSFEGAPGHVRLSMQIIDRRRGETVRAWQHDLEGQEAESGGKLIDGILYPLMFHFNAGLGARRWESLHALHAGLEAFQDFSDDQAQSRHLQAALKEIEQAIKRDPAYGLAHYDLGLIYLAAGDHETARRHLLDASRLLKDRSLSQWATYNYGVALFQQAQDWAYERAAKTFLSLIESGACPKELVVMARSALAATYARMAARHGKGADQFAAQALAEADRVLQASPSDEAAANALVAQGYAHLAVGQFDPARDAFQSALERDDDNLSALLGLGETHYRKDEPEEAISLLRQATLVSPLGGYAHYHIGELYRKMGSTDDAVDAYQKAASLALARVALGKIYLASDRLTDALAEFEAATRINSRSSDAWENIAWTLLEIDDDSRLAEAEDAARRSVQLEKNDDLLWHRQAVLSRCLLRRGRIEPALKAARLAVELRPNQPQAQHALALVQLRRGEIDQAREGLRKVLSLDHSGYWHPQAEALLKDLERTANGAPQDLTGRPA